jgi:hypothetical protein
VSTLVQGNRPQAHRQLCFRDFMISMFWHGLIFKSIVFWNHHESSDTE